VELADNNKHMQDLLASEAKGLIDYALRLIIIFHAAIILLLLASLRTSSGSLLCY
jgi:hypothetical protein